ncbi:MAG: hypothetical protein HN350_02290 [Phycisphaerales bacterium]|nr:hypothetical protein [Phycisphaerales bacterium]
MTKFLNTALILCLLSQTAMARKQPPTKPIPQPITEDRFEISNIEGWTTYINRDVRKQHPEALTQTLDHLKWELYQIKLAVPQAAVSNMQKHTPNWIEYSERVSLSYHPGRRWLIDRGYKLPKDPPSMMSLSVKSHYRDSYRHPFVIFHEMVHGYDFHFIGKGRGYGNKECEANYQRMMKTKTYEKVKIWNGHIGSHYARSNRMEYFAESSEAYFAVNDIYPFVRAELREHDPKMARLIERYWGVDAEQIVQLETDLAAYQANTPQPTRRKNYTPTPKYDKRKIYGWTVYVNPELTAQPGLCNTMVKLLSYKLHMIDHFVGPEGKKQLNRTPVWLEIGRAGPYVRYCGNKTALQKENANPDKFQAVEVRNPQRMMDWSMLQQADVLGAVARAYYEQTPSLAKNTRDAYTKAKAGGKYKSVLRFDGKKLPHPALESERSYFAEMMKSYFLVNDRYPFIRCELKDQDPDGYKLIADLWEGVPRR